MRHITIFLSLLSLQFHIYTISSSAPHLCVHNRHCLRPSGSIHYRTMKHRGGAIQTTTQTDSSPLAVSDKLRISHTPTSFALTAWGTLGVVIMLANAIKRLFPVAILPLIRKDLESTHVAAYILWTLYMIYAEGYKAFHLKFSPLVVRRALTISDNPSFLKCVLAGPYSMGLFGATKQRMIVSWLIMVGVFGLVKVVKLVPYPWRSIIDSGVVAGLSVGTLSILWHFIRTFFGYIPDIDPCLPNGNREVETKNKEE